MKPETPEAGVISPSSWIIWQAWTIEGNVIQLRTDTVKALSGATALDPGSPERAKQYFKLFDGSSLPRAEIGSGALPAPSEEPRQGILHFWTITCKLRINAQVEIEDFRLAGDKSKAYKHPIMDLIDSHGAFAGRAVLHIEPGIPFSVTMEFIVHSISPSDADEGTHYLGLLFYSKDKEIGLGRYALQKWKQAGQSDSSEDEEEVDDKEHQNLSEPGLDAPHPTITDPLTEVNEDPEAQSDDRNEDDMEEDIGETISISNYASGAYPPLRERKQRRFFNVIAIQRHDDGVAERVGVGKILESAIRDSFDEGPVWSEVLLG
ncbi:hypothetical protein BGZ57DRAFT_856689 [Hyaloscypha finlandica]|nr:hypothetical protein BGZ57DRAFT_856689 [Hyaloscypha finlandica]